MGIADVGATHLADSRPLCSLVPLYLDKYRLTNNDSISYSHLDDPAFSFIR